MRRSWMLALLATTSLAGMPAARADTLIESSLGTFGHTQATATTLTGPNAILLGNVDNYGTGTVDWFTVTGGPVSALTLSFVASGAIRIDPGQYLPASYSEGLSFPFALPAANGHVVSTGTGLSLAVLSGSGSGSTNPLAPVVSFYDDAGDLLNTFALTEGTSFAIGGTLLADADLNFSISAPFDYAVNLDVVQTPEPASAALLGLSAAALAALRRRKRVV
jgi:hypothetical protein